MIRCPCCGYLTIDDSEKIIIEICITGQVYLRARFYEPEMNRFSQKDVLRGNVFSGTSLNRYLYCGDDPVNFTDPSGMRQVENDNPQKDSVSRVVKTNNSANAKAEQIRQQALLDAQRRALQERRLAEKERQSGEPQKPPKPNAPAVESPTPDIFACSHDINALGAGDFSITWADIIDLAGASSDFIEEYSTDSNMYGSIISGLSTAFSTLFKGVENSITTAVRPANIGAGIFAKQMAQELDDVVKMSSKFSKAFDILAYGAVVIDVGVGVYDNINAGSPVDKIVSDALVDASVTGITVAITTGIGTAIGGPVGAVVGYAVGLGIYYFSDMIPFGPDGESLRDLAKDYTMRGEQSDNKRICI